jgi:hypothetical protein
MPSVLVRCALVALAVATAACSSDNDDNVVVISPTVPGAIFTVRWTVGGLSDPTDCTANGVDTIEITVFDGSNAEVGTFRQVCTAFATSIPLAPGTYSAAATLLDGQGNPRTTTVFIPPFDLVGTDTLAVPIDFPLASFFALR